MQSMFVTGAITVGAEFIERFTCKRAARRGISAQLYCNCRVSLFLCLSVQ